MIKFEGGVNEIQHIQCSLLKIAEEQTKDKVWSEVISCIEQGRLPEKTEMFTKAANRNRICVADMPTRVYG